MQSFVANQQVSWVLGRQGYGDCHEICSRKNLKCNEALGHEAAADYKNVKFEGIDCQGRNEWNYGQGFSQCTDKKCCLDASCQYHCSATNSWTGCRIDEMNRHHSRICPCSISVSQASCKSKLEYTGIHGAKGIYSKASNLHNGKALYRHVTSDWCIFYARHWKLDACSFVDEKLDWSQGYVWTDVKASCPEDVGSNWRYYSWDEEGSDSGPIDKSILIIPPGKERRLNTIIIIKGLKAIHLFFYFFSDEYTERGSVRLSDYPKGRVEIYTGNEWGTLCGHYW